MIAQTIAIPASGVSFGALRTIRWPALDHHFATIFRRVRGGTFRARKKQSGDEWKHWRCVAGSIKFHQVRAGDK